MKEYVEYFNEVSIYSGYRVKMGLFVYYDFCMDLGLQFYLCSNNNDFYYVFEFYWGLLEIFLSRGIQEDLC